MKVAILLWATTLAAQPRLVPFGPNDLRVEKGADLIAGPSTVELKRGAVTYFLADSGAPPIEIATPNVTVHPYFSGKYRIEVSKKGETTIIPLGGDVKVASPAGVQWLPVGKKMIVRGPETAPQFRIVSAVPLWRQIGLFLAQNANVAVDAGGGSDDSSEPASSKPAPAPRSVSANNDASARTGSAVGRHGK